MPVYYAENGNSGIVIGSKHVLEQAITKGWTIYKEVDGKRSLVENPEEISFNQSIIIPIVSDTNVHEDVRADIDLIAMMTGVKL